jgi:hypothetical protein
MSFWKDGSFSAGSFDQSIPCRAAKFPIVGVNFVPPFISQKLGNRESEDPFDGGCNVDHLPFSIDHTDYRFHGIKNVLGKSGGGKSGTSGLRVNRRTIHARLRSDARLRMRLGSSDSLPCYSGRL